MKYLICFLSFFIKNLCANGQAQKDITGIWLNEEKNRTIQIYKDKNGFNAKMHALYLPDAKYKTGMLVIKSLRNENGLYKNGKAYVPGYGWVDCTALLQNEKLYITGTKLGISRTRSYTRVH